MEPKRKIEPVVRIFDSFEAADRADDKFYLSLTPKQRLDILLALVKRAQGGTYQRIEEVCRIVPLGDEGRG